MSNETGQKSRICSRCGVIIADETWHCPLCKGALTMEDAVEAGAARSLAYPDISDRFKKMKFVIRVVIFVSIIAAGILFVINYMTFQGVYWSLLAAAGLAYVCTTLVVSFRKKKSLQARIGFQCVLGAVLLVGLDHILGYSGWSVKYGIPIIILAADLIAAVIMSVYRTGWQSYIIMLIYACVFGAVLFLLEVTGVLPLSPLGMIAAAVSALMLAGTLLFGRRKIREEVRRRFRV